MHHMPWFWDVMKQRMVPSWMAGWLCPRLPKASLYVLAPMANASS